MGTESSVVAVGKFAGPGAGLDASDFVEDVVTEREIVTGGVQQFYEELRAGSWVDIPIFISISVKPCTSHNADTHSSVYVIAK
jgi:hypothetical protein